MQQKSLVGIQNTKMACIGNRLKTSICKMKNLIQKANNNFGCLLVSWMMVVEAKVKFELDEEQKLQFQNVRENEGEQEAFYFLE